MRSVADGDIFSRVNTPSRAGNATIAAPGLEDVGVQPESRAFVPLLRPEVVKLDLTLLRTVMDPAMVMVARGVGAYTEQAGAEVVAEGTGTPQDRTRVLVFGVTLGQGWLCGRGERRFAAVAFALNGSRRVRSGRRCTRHRMS